MVANAVSMMEEVRIDEGQQTEFRMKDFPEIHQTCSRGEKLDIMDKMCCALPSGSTTCSG